MGQEDAQGNVNYEGVCGQGSKWMSCWWVRKTHKAMSTTKVCVVRVRSEWVVDGTGGHTGQCQLRRCVWSGLEVNELLMGQEDAQGNVNYEGVCGQG